MRALPTGGRAVGIAAALLVLYVVWGSTYLGIALAIETMPPLLMAAARFLVAGALLYALTARVAGRPGRREWLWAVVTGVPLLLVGNGGVVWAQQTVPSGVAALLIASVALWIALFDRVFYGRRLGPRALAGLVLGFAGVGILVGTAGTADVPLAGALLLVAAGAGWATGTLLARGAALPENTLMAAAMQMLAGGGALLAVALAAGEGAAVDASAFSLRSLAGWAYLVVFGSVLAFSVYGWLLKATRTSLVATYAYVNPIVAVLLGWVVLGEEIAARTLVAGAIVVLAVALIVSAPALPRADNRLTRAVGRRTDRAPSHRPSRGGHAGEPRTHRRQEARVDRVR